MNMADISVTPDVLKEERSREEQWQPANIEDILERFDVLKGERSREEHRQPENAEDTSVYTI